MKEIEEKIKKLDEEAERVFNQAAEFHANPQEYSHTVYLKSIAHSLISISDLLAEMCTMKKERDVI